MPRRFRSRAAALAAGLLFFVGGLGWAAAEKAATVYKWIDENGTVHYGDAVPPQYADQEQTVLNRHGVTVGTIPGRRSAEQQAGDDAAKSADEASREARRLNLQRDQNLLATYLSSAEIESLRDRRLEILDGQVRVLSQYVDQLKRRSDDLEQQVRAFRPYSKKSNAIALPQPFAAEIVRTVSDLRAQERSLRAKRDEMDQTRARFTDDLRRFQELKASGHADPGAR